jgi:hypothetical protein
MKPPWRDLLAEEMGVSHEELVRVIQASTTSGPTYKRRPGTPIRSRTAERPQDRQE